jgi:GxxExxY protein
MDGEPDPLSHRFLGAATCVHLEPGPGLLESVYATCLAHELAKRRIPFTRGARLPVVYGGRTIGNALRLDFLVAETLVIELKAVEQVLPVHRAQLLTYLRLGGFRRGLLVNFNVRHLMSGVTRFVL